MHWPTQGQWWSNFWTQLLQMEQCDVRGGRYSRHVSQYLTFTTTPLTTTSLVRGTRRWGLAAFTHSVDGVVMSTTCSSTPTSGGRAFLGTIPGSLLDVRSRNAKSCRHFTTREESAAVL